MLKRLLREWLSSFFLKAAIKKVAFLVFRSFFSFFANAFQLGTDFAGTL
jgi:hypothetical protein